MTTMNDVRPLLTITCKMDQTIGQNVQNKPFIIRRPTYDKIQHYDKVLYENVQNFLEIKLNEQNIQSRRF